MIFTHLPRQIFKETILRAIAEEVLAPAKWPTTCGFFDDFKALSLFSCISDCLVNILASNLECNSETKVPGVFK